MKITFVGTGSGKTALKRYHSSLLLSFDGYNLLVDAGDSVSRALLKAEIKYNSINGILFTHLHPDHFSGLGALIVQMKMFKRTNPLEIFVFKDLIGEVKNYLLTCNLLSEKMDFEIIFRPFSDNAEFLVNERLKIIPRENSHLSELNKYSQYSNKSFYCASFLFSYKNKNLIYTGDIGSKKDLELFNEFKADILVSEITHITISDLLEKLVILGSPRTYITHITDDDEAGIVHLLDKLSPDGKKIELANDRQTIQF